jgi:type VI secretion system secreted protein Hcp
MTFRSLITAFVAGSVIFGSSIALADGTVTVEGTKTKFTPDHFTGITYEVKSPRDMATGQASGKRQHAPMCIYKATSQTTPQWFAAVTTNEVLKSVIFETTTLRIKLVNATVSELKFLGADGKDLEQVCFTFDRIEFSHPKTGTTAADDWRAK